MKQMLCLVLVAFVLCACGNKNWDTLSLRKTEEKLEVVDAEEALTSLLWNSDDIQNWKMLHKQKVPTEYYRFTGSFVVEGADDVDGTLTALLIADGKGIRNYVENGVHRCATGNLGQILCCRSEWGCSFCACGGRCLSKDGQYPVQYAPPGIRGDTALICIFEDNHLQFIIHRANQKIKFENGSRCMGVTHFPVENLLFLCYTVEKLLWRPK